MSDDRWVFVTELPLKIFCGGVNPDRQNFGIECKTGSREPSHGRQDGPNDVVMEYLVLLRGVGAVARAVVGNAVAGRSSASRHVMADRSVPFLNGLDKFREPGGIRLDVSDEDNKRKDEQHDIYTLEALGISR